MTRKIEELEKEELIDIIYTLFAMMNNACTYLQLGNAAHLPFVICAPHTRRVLHQTKTIYCYQPTNHLVSILSQDKHAIVDQYPLITAPS